MDFQAYVVGGIKCGAGPGSRVGRLAAESLNYIGEKWDFPQHKASKTLTPI